jgi:ribonuclease HI
MGLQLSVGKRVCAEASGAYNETTSSMRMEIEAATAAIQWLVRNYYTNSVIVTDSMSMLAKVERNLLRLSGDKH